MGWRGPFQEGCGAWKCQIECKVRQPFVLRSRDDPETEPKRDQIHQMTTNYDPKPGRCDDRDWVVTHLADMT